MRDQSEVAGHVTGHAAGDAAGLAAARRPGPRRVGCAPIARRPPEIPVSTLCSRVLAQVQVSIVTLLKTVPRPADGRVPTLVDVGCWQGEGTARYAEAMGGALQRGIEVFEAPARASEGRGIEVARVDLERDVFPWPDGSADVVVCNQVLEHLKNIWLPMAEMHRVLRVGGHAVLSVPNLGSLHNRALMAFGRQPTSIRTFGPHVRGYTFREFRDFVTRDGGFALVRARGVGFYPLPSPAAEPLAALWPGASHTTVLLVRKASERSPWREFVRDELEKGLQTFYEA
jgi:SAM-dependent methyltransferase